MIVIAAAAKSEVSNATSTDPDVTPASRVEKHANILKELYGSTRRNRFIQAHQSQSTGFQV
jgi:hypothetical protein